MSTSLTERPIAILRTDSSSAVGDVNVGTSLSSASPRLPTPSPAFVTALDNAAKTAASVAAARTSTDGMCDAGWYETAGAAARASAKEPAPEEITGDATRSSARGVGVVEEESAVFRRTSDAAPDAEPIGLRAAIGDATRGERSPRATHKSGRAARTAARADAALRGSATTAYSSRSSGAARACAASSCARRASACARSARASRARPRAAGRP